MNDLDTAARALGYDLRELLPVELAFARADLRLAALEDAGLHQNAASLLAQARSRWDIEPAPTRPLGEHPVAAIAALAAAIAGEEPGKPAENSREAKAANAPITVVKWDAFTDELEGMARSVQVATRRADAPVEPARVCVVAPNRQWASLAEKALRHRRFEVRMPRARLGFTSDPRDAEKSRALVAYNKLRLLADANNVCAWRTRLGMGKADLACHAWMALVNHAQKTHSPVLDALLALDDQAAFAGAAQLIEGRDRCLAFINAKSGLEGFSLVSAIGADNLPEFEEAVGRLEPGDGAMELLSYELDAFAHPSLAGSPDAVRVATYDTLVGCSDEFDLVWLIACVDGLVGDSAEKDPSAVTRHLSRLLFANAVARANQELVVSYFSHATIDVARKAGMRSVRTRPINGAPHAMLRPSPFLLEAGSALPGTTSGQALLA